jgi:hypothetical protein
MKKKILAGTMALALMAGQFSTMAFADSKDMKAVTKPVVIKAQMVKVTNGKSQIQGKPLTEKEMEAFMKNWKGLNLSTANSVKVTDIVRDAKGNVLEIKAVPMTDLVPASQTIPAVKIVPAQVK